MLRQRFRRRAFEDAIGPLRVTVIGAAWRTGRETDPREENV